MSNSRQSRRRAPDWFEQVRSFGVTFRAGHFPPSNQYVPSHTPEWHQLVYATEGSLMVRTDEFQGVVPPHRALWIPSSVDYRFDIPNAVALRMLYIRVRRREPSTPCSVVNVTPLMRELIIRTNLIGALDARIPEHFRLIGVIRDELRALRSVPLQLPMPRDARAVKFASLASANPAAHPPLAKMLRKCGASRRTMERLFQEETSMGLGQWLRQQNLMHAVGRLADGEAVNTVAEELGYNSSSAFIAMFRRELGQTPARYFAG
jgi:AraC-like DNA-binding protein